jgi:cytochrome c biogenesis protein CcdA
VAISVGGALGGLALLGLQGMGATLPMLLAIAIGATLAAGVWRWRRAEAAAPAWPTGRWG